LDVLKKLGKGSIRATDIAAQYWCERQMELNYIYGAKITAEIKKGRKLHEAMENETNTPIPIVLMPKNFADVMYKILYTSCCALDSLIKNKIAREIQVYGAINGFTLVGKMDQLELRDGEVFVWEDKTKTSDNVPTEPQMLAHKVQVMVYRKMMADLIDRVYTIDMFRKKYGITTLRVSDEFARQLDMLEIPKQMQTVDAVAIKFFETFPKLGKISDVLHIRYINQFTGKEIKLYKFNYDEKEINKELEFVLKYWNGERESLPVPESEKWKCGWCGFFGKECKVWWPQKKL
jgi:exonuclease V